MDNTLLKTSIYWPSEEIVRFEVKVGVCKKFAKRSSHFMQKNHAKQQCQTAIFYVRLSSCHHGNDSVAWKCAVTSVPDISVLGHG